MNSIVLDPGFSVAPVKAGWGWGEREGKAARSIMIRSAFCLRLAHAADEVRGEVHPLVPPAGDALAVDDEEPGPGHGVVGKLAHEAAVVNHHARTVLAHEPGAPAGSCRCTRHQRAPAPPRARDRRRAFGELAAAWQQAADHHDEAVFAGWRLREGDTEAAPPDRPHVVGGRPSGSAVAAGASSSAAGAAHERRERDERETAEDEGDGEAGRSGMAGAAPCRI